MSLHMGRQGAARLRPRAPAPHGQGRLHRLHHPGARATDPPDRPAGRAAGAFGVSAVAAPPGLVRHRELPPPVKRLLICLAGGVVLALMTGKSGSTTAPASGITGTFKSAEAYICI